jgi:signal transduction histidine kinase
VYVDAELVGRVLINLIDNALKHSPRDSTVTVKIVPEPANEGPRSMDYDAAVEDLTDSSNQAVRCTVLDMGPGIPYEYRQRVFERFAQLDRRRKGKGLGLAFCQLAIEAHGGKIWVEDNPRGKGSAFIFTLPTVTPEFLAPITLPQSDD